MKEEQKDQGEIKRYGIQTADNDKNCTFVLP